jgi:hypothetical protein
MARLILLLSFLLCFHSSFAQKIRFTDTSNSWRVVMAWPFGSPPGQQSVNYHYQGPILIDTVKWCDFQFGYLREDTTTRKVYVRNLNIVASGVSLVDTQERMLYDYNWIVGDSTVQVYGVDSFKCFVVSIDSTQIGSIWHRLWYFKSTFYSADTLKDTNDFTVIEGLGSNKGPWFPVYPNEGNRIPDFNFYAFGIACFHNNGVQPKVNPAVGIAYHVGFDNYASCILSVDEIDAEKKTALVIPNPANTQSKIVLPYIIQSGTVAIVNAVGQIVYKQEIKNKETIPLDKAGLSSGVYFYQVWDALNGKGFSGRFVWE